jgi:broad specificity phosphatase PhoE
MELRLFAIRHGATDWSRERRFSGSRDIPLSAEGRLQCAALAQTLAPLSIAVLYASPLVRARESAQAIATAQGIDVTLEPGFREMSFGDWEGLTRDEVARRFPEDYATWRTAPERFARPGSEPLSAVAERVMRGLDELRATHRGETVVLVTHAVVTRLIVLAALGLGPERLWSIEASPAGISEIEYRDDWATVHRVNTLAHLEADVDSRGVPGSPGHPERRGVWGPFRGPQVDQSGLGGPSRPPIQQSPPVQ